MMFDERMLQRTYNWCVYNADKYGDEHMRVSAACIKKQMPKLAKNIETDSMGITSGDCPECGCGVFQETDVYCPDCGQRLKWVEW